MDFRHVLPGAKKREFLQCPPLLPQILDVTHCFLLRLELLLQIVDERRNKPCDEEIGRNNPAEHLEIRGGWGRSSGSRRRLGSGRIPRRTRRVGPWIRSCHDLLRRRRTNYWPHVLTRNSE